MKTNIVPQKTNKKLLFFWDVFITILATYAAIEIPFSIVAPYMSAPLITFMNIAVMLGFAIDFGIRLYITPKRTTHTYEIIRAIRPEILPQRLVGYRFLIGYTIRFVFAVCRNRCATLP